MKKDSRGQLPIIIAITLSGIIIFSALIAYRTSLLPKSIESSDWIHVIVNVDRDFKRILRISLANFTRELIETGNATSSEFKARVKLEVWRIAFSLGYVASNLNISIHPKGKILLNEFSYTLQIIKDGSIYNQIINIPYLKIKDGFFFNYSWDQPYSVSMAYASINLDVAKDGVYGWNNSYTVFSSINVTKIIIDSNLNIIMIYFNFCTEDDSYSKLNENCISIIINDTPISFDSLIYYGLGNYSVKAKYTSYPQKIALIVTDCRGIIVVSKVILN
ncbi:MAG: hypothetical protein QXO74_02845 [Candidatus Methanomethylicia archaeon]